MQADCNRNADVVSMEHCSQITPAAIKLLIDVCLFADPHLILGPPEAKILVKHICFKEVIPQFFFLFVSMELTLLTA